MIVGVKKEKKIECKKRTNFECKKGQILDTK